MKRKLLVSIVATTVVLILGIILIYPSVYEYCCKNRVYTDIRNQLNAYESANICIIRSTMSDEDCYGYSVGASGVIFKKENDEYYALTAYHVIKEQNNTIYLIRTTNDKSISEYRELHPEMGHTSLEEYYSQFPICDILYTNEASDIAIIKFNSKQELNVVSVADKNPGKGTRLVCIGQDGEQNIHFKQTFGKITSSKLDRFVTSDNQSENSVLKTNAYGVAGFSGGAVLDEDMNLIGVNIGGGTDFLGRFRYEAIIPCEQLDDCIREFDNCKE